MHGRQIGCRPCGKTGQVRVTDVEGARTDHGCGQSLTINIALTDTARVAFENLPESRIAGLFDSIDDRTVEAFAALGNETRMAILLALWDAKSPATQPFGPKETLTFSELYDRVEYDQTANFNYHLEMLTGPFVHKTDQGYALTNAAERILSVVLAGMLFDRRTFEGESIEAGCMLCGEPTVVDYSDGALTQRCSNCDGLVQEPGDPPGLIAREYRPPAGLHRRTPQEFVQHGKMWDRHRRHMFVEGVCPNCTGRIDATLSVCKTHETGTDRICDECGKFHEIEAEFVCEVCKVRMVTGVWSTIFVDIDVLSFFYDHGLDTRKLEDSLEYGVLFDAIEQVEVIGADPVEILVTVELEGDRIAVTLDDESTVVDVTPSVE